MTSDTQLIWKTKEFHEVAVFSLTHGHCEGNLISKTKKRKASKTATLKDFLDLDTLEQTVLRKKIPELLCH